MARDPAFDTHPELAELLKPFMDSVNQELHHLKRVIYDLHTRERYSEARKSTMTDVEVVRRKKLIAKLLKLNFQELFKQPVEYTENYLKEWYSWATHSRLEPNGCQAYTVHRYVCVKGTSIRN